MRNIPIIGKFLFIMTAFGIFTLAVAAYTGNKIWSIDSQYSALITNESTAALYTSRANRALQGARASIAEVVMLREPTQIKAADALLADSRKSFEAFMDKAIEAAPGNAALPALKAEGIAIMDKECLVSLKAGRMKTGETGALANAAVDQYGKKCQPQILDTTSKMAAVVNELEKAAYDRSDALTVMSIATIWTTFAIIGGGLALVLAGGFLAVRGWLVTPLKALAASMRTLADGHLETEIDGQARKDEVGGMARAVQVFKDNGLKARALADESDAMRNQTDEERRRTAEADRIRSDAMTKATQELGDGLKQVAGGNLLVQLVDPFAAEYETLRNDFNAAVAQLREALHSVAQTTTQIDSGTREISQSADDLSKRTEQQAASLEETAAALDQITANVSNSSKRADEARSVAVQANASAAHSGAVVANAVDAMQKIEQSSNQISNIIGVIDEIAFQTNLLALNAGVEAARAGDAGKGFAVVAQEVRELAQRSAKAAKEIKELIRTSSGDVQNGVKLVSETGEALKTIEGYIVTINQHMDAIATSSREQSTGLAEVNTAVNQMDQVTQQNAAMVEESNAASATLAGEAGRLRELVSQFELGGDSSNQASALRQTAASMASPHSSSQAARRPAPAARPVSHGNTALKQDEWTEF